MSAGVIEVEGHGPAPKLDRRAVIEGQLVYTSVSAMQKADNDHGGCLRQWYFKYVQRLPDSPPGKGQLRGIQGHGRIEKYLRHSINVLDERERLGIVRGLIPTPGPDLLVEEHFGTPTPLLAQGVPMVGYIDLINPRFLSEGVLDITDWKFKASIEKYGASADDLVDPTSEAGIQMIGYGAWAHAAQGRFPLPFDRVRLRHATFQTQGAQDVAQVEKTVTLQSLPDSWEIVTRRIIPPMREAAKQTEFLKVPDNRDSTFGCNRCAYKATCLDSMSRIVQGFKNARQKDASKNDVVNQEAAQMGMLSKMKSTQAENTVSATAAPAASAPTPDPIPKQSTSPVAKKMVIVPEGGLLASEAVQGKHYTVNGVPAVFLTSVGYASGARKASFAPESGAMPILIDHDTVIMDGSVPLVVPTDAPKSDPALAAKLPAAPVQGDAVVTPAAAEEKAKRTRATKAEMEARRAAESATAEPTAGADAIKAQQGTQLNLNSAIPNLYRAEGGYSLYFAGTPMGVEIKTLHGYVAELDAGMREAKQIKGVTDIRAIATQDLGFGKWKGVLAEIAAQCPPPPGHYVVTAGDERIECVAQALIPSAAFVVLR